MEIGCKITNFILETQYSVANPRDPFSLLLFLWLDSFTAIGCGCNIYTSQIQVGGGRVAEPDLMTCLWLTVIEEDSINYFYFVDNFNFS